MADRQVVVCSYYLDEPLQRVEYELVSVIVLVLDRVAVLR